MVVVVVVEVVEKVSETFFKYIKMSENKNYNKAPGCNDTK